MISSKNKPQHHKNIELKCGMCKWFKTPYKRKDCQERFNSETNTMACIEFERLQEEPNWTLIEQDIFLLKLFKCLNNPVLIIDESIVKELNTYYVATKKDEHGDIRRIPVVFNSEDDLGQIGVLLEETQSLRDRVTEIQLSMIPIKNELDKLSKIGEAYIWKNSVYSKWLKDLNVGPREAMFRNLLMPVKDKYVLAKSIIQSCELVMNNLNATGFVLKDQKEIGEYILNSKRARQATI